MIEPSRSDSINYLWSEQYKNGADILNHTETVVEKMFDQFQESASEFIQLGFKISKALIAVFCGLVVGIYLVIWRRYINDLTYKVWTSKCMIKIIPS